MITTEKKEIFDWFLSLKDKGLSQRHIQKIAKEKRKEISDVALLKYFDLLAFNFTTDKREMRNAPYNKQKNVRRSNSLRDRNKYGIHAKIIYTPMGGQNKNQK